MLFTESEVELMRLASLGITNREIAKIFGLSHSGIGARIHELCEKLNLTSKVQLAIFYMENKDFFEIKEYSPRVIAKVKEALLENKLTHPRIAYKYGVGTVKVKAIALELAKGNNDDANICS